MINSIIINNNSANEVKIKNINEENIYKKCNFKNPNDFSKLHSWQYDDTNHIELWGKNKGFKNSKSCFIIFKNMNIDIFGKSLFLMKNDDKYISLNINTFNDFFNINNTENTNKENKETTNKDNIIAENLDAKDAKDDDKCLVEQEDKLSEYSYNSELSYELYCYSSDESE